MRVATLPLGINLTAHAGATFVREFRWRPGGAAQDFTGWSALLSIGPRGAAAIKTLSTSDGSVTLSSDGLVHIEMSPADTAALASSSAFNLDLTDPSGAVLRLLRGTLTVARGVAA